MFWDDWDAGDVLGAVGTVYGGTIGAGVGAMGGIVGGMAGGAAGEAVGGMIDGGGNGGGTDGANLGWRNPGQIDLWHENPRLSGEIARMNTYRQNFDHFAQDYTDPGRYLQMRDRESSRATTSASNRMAAMGLGGTSAGIGAVSEAGLNSDQRMMDRQMNDQLRIAQMQSAMSNQIQSGIFAGQNQFGNFQNNVMGAKSRADAADAAATQQMWGSIGTIGGTVAGAYFGGPAGAAVGGMAGNQIMGGNAPQQSPQGYTPTPYEQFSNQPQMGGYSDYGSMGGGYSPGYYG